MIGRRERSYSENSAQNGAAHRKQRCGAALHEPHGAVTPWRAYDKRLDRRPARSCRDQPRGSRQRHENEAHARRQRDPEKRCDDDDGQQNRHKGTRSSASAFQMRRGNQPRGSQQVPVTGTARLNKALTVTSRWPAGPILRCSASKQIEQCFQRVRHILVTNSQPMMVTK